MLRIRHSAHFGRLLCGPIRQGFERIKFMYPDEFDYHEGSGFLSRDFHISASERVWDQFVVPHVNRVVRHFKD
jgi:hypothetical protein